MIYDKNAVASTAVSAFLTQFKISENGDIRYISGTDTFHGKWLHKSLQKLAWDFTASGDDEISLAKPNPSTSAALDTIITLLNHTASYSVNYNIDDIVATYLFGASIEQDGGDTRYSGYRVGGSVNSPTELDVIQNNTILTSHWSTGKNETDSKTLLRILIKTVENGNEIDNSRVLVKANKWGDSFAYWEVNLGLGETGATIITSYDPNNQTSQAIVEAYTGISNTEGYSEINIGDGSGLKPYLANWTYGANNKAKMYEFVKSILVNGTAEIMYGISADLFIGATGSFNYDGLSGTFTEPEEISWANGTGQLMADSGTEIWFQLLTGVPPVDDEVITGATSGATCDVNGNTTALAPTPNHLGLFTGTAILYAFGIGSPSSELTKDDSLKPLTGELLAPPNNVVVKVEVDGATSPHVHLARKDGATGGILYNEYTAEAGNTSGNGTYIIKEAIKSDTPQTGFVLIKEGTTHLPFEYTSWTGSTFTLSGTLSENITEDKNSYIPIMYNEATGSPKVLIKGLIYSSDINVVGWVRSADPDDAFKPVEIAGTIGSSGFSTSVTLSSE